jgi:hypothetical protein
VTSVAPGALVLARLAQWEIGRAYIRTKTEPDEKVKKPTDGVRKKSPPARKAPARGRYVDEYARPAF